MDTTYGSPGVPSDPEIRGLAAYLLQREQGKTDLMPLLFLEALSPGLAWLVLASPATSGSLECQEVQHVWGGGCSP